MALNEPIPLVLADCADSRAVERAVWELATRLPKARFAARVWLPSDPAKNDFADALAARDVPVDRMPSPGSSWGFRGTVGAWMKLRRARPTLMHVHQSWPQHDGISASLTDAAGVRFRIVTAHGARTPESMSGASRRAIERADVVTTTCDAFAEQIVAESGLKRDRVRLVASGVDGFDQDGEQEAAHAVRDQCGAGLIRPLWLFAGRLEPHRGCQVFIEALGLVKDRGLPFVALVVGDGPQREELESRAAHLGLGASVHFLPAPGDPGPLLLAADAVVLPSLWDGGSVVLAQALVRGRPVVATTVGSAPDLIENGMTGRLVPPGDAKAVADALESYHRRPEAAQRVGRQAALHATDELLWPRVVEAYEAVYDEVLGLATFHPEPAAVARGRW